MIDFNQETKRFFTALRSAEQILLVAHKKPDGDTLGASLSLLTWFLSQNKKVTAYCSDLPAKTYNFLDNIHHFTNDHSVFDLNHDLVIVLDSGDLRYCGIDEHLKRLPKNHVLVNIDHHSTNERYGHINLVAPESCSTCEIIFHMFEIENIRLNASLSTSLITGLLSDTSSLTNSSTTMKSLEIASKLLAGGARITDFQKSVLHDKPVSLLKNWGILLSRLRLNPIHKIAFTYFLREDVNDELVNAADGLANFLSAVVGETDVVMVLKEKPNGTIKGSLRSTSRDVSALAKYLGGGGHKKAAGFTIKGRIIETPNGLIIAPLSVSTQ